MMQIPHLHKQGLRDTTSSAGGEWVVNGESVVSGEWVLGGEWVLDAE